MRCCIYSRSSCDDCAVCHRLCREENMSEMPPLPRANIHRVLCQARRKQADGAAFPRDDHPVPPPVPEEIKPAMQALALAKTRQCIPSRAGRIRTGDAARLNWKPLSHGSAVVRPHANSFGWWKRFLWVKSASSQSFMPRGANTWWAAVPPAWLSSLVLMSLHRNLTPLLPWQDRLRWRDELSEERSMGCFSWLACTGACCAGDCTTAPGGSSGSSINSRHEQLAHESARDFDCANVAADVLAME